MRAPSKKLHKTEQLKYFGLLPADIAQWEERWTREQNVSGHYWLWVGIPGWPNEITNSFSDETLNRGNVWRCSMSSTLKNKRSSKLLRPVSLHYPL